MTVTLLEAVPYLRAYSGQTFVVKAGGGLFDRASGAALLGEVATLHRLGIRVVLVHGGGPQLDRAAKERGLETRKVAGRRITSPETLALAKEIWVDGLGARLVGELSKQGEAAVALSGSDDGLLQARRRPPAVITDDAGHPQTVDFGAVGDPVSVNADVLSAVLAKPAVPVVSPLAVDADGNLLNVNADTVAAWLAVGMGAAKLILATEAPGVLEDPTDPTSVLHWTDLAELTELENQGVLSGGMRPKLAAMRHALDNGVARVHVIDGRRPGALLEEIFTTAGSGTLVVRESEEAPPEPLA